MANQKNGKPYMAYQYGSVMGKPIEIPMFITIFCSNLDLKYEKSRSNRSSPVQLDYNHIHCGVNKIVC